MKRGTKLIRVSESAHEQACKLAVADLRSISNTVEYLIQQEFRRRYGPEKVHDLAEVPQVERVAA